MDSTTPRDWRRLQGWRRRWRQRSTVRLWTATARHRAVAIYRASVRSSAPGPRALPRRPAGRPTGGLKQDVQGVPQPPQPLAFNQGAIDTRRGARGTRLLAASNRQPCRAPSAVQNQLTAPQGVLSVAFFFSPVATVMRPPQRLLRRWCWRAAQPADRHRRSDRRLPPPDTARGAGAPRW